MKRNKLFILICSLFALFVITSCTGSGTSSNTTTDSLKNEVKQETEKVGELLGDLSVNEYIGRQWTEPASGAQISIEYYQEEGRKSYIWQESGKPDPIYFSLTTECAKDASAEFVDEGTIISMFINDAVVCYKPQALRMSDGSMKLLMTDLSDNTTRTLLEVKK